MYPLKLLFQTSRFETLPSPSRPPASPGAPRSFQPPQCLHQLLGFSPGAEKGAQGVACPEDKLPDCQHPQALPV